MHLRKILSLIMPFAASEIASDPPFYPACGTVCANREGAKETMNSEGVGYGQILDYSQ
jgi:hypothetical protein